MKTIVSKITNRKAFFKGTDTLEIGYPWLSFGAIIALESIVNKNLNVLEFGSGGSTIFWAKTCKAVKSYETDIDWYIKVKEKTKNLKNTELIFGDQELILRNIKQEPNNHYDIILIDLYPKHAQREIITNAAIPKLKKDGYIIVDNYNNFGMQNFKYPTNWDIYTFDEFRYSGRGTRICKKIQ